MQSLCRRVVVGLFCLCLSLSSGVLAGGEDSSSGDPKKGKEKYEQFCKRCHGPRARGNGPMAKATTPPAANLMTSEIRNLPDKELKRRIAEGVGTAMPAWQGILNEQQLDDVVAYIRAL